MLCMFTAQMIIGQNKARAIDSMLTNYSKLGLYNGSALVYQNNDILLSKGYGIAHLKDKKSNSSQSIFQIYSITKPFTSTLVLMLDKQKKLSIDDKVSKYISNFPKGDSITIKQLLSHTSGLFEYTSEQNNFSAFEKEKFLTYLNSKPFYFSPGTDWSYSNSGYWLLGFIIEKVTKMSYEKSIEKYIFKKLKMKNSGLNYAKLKSEHKTMGYVTLEGGDGIEAEIYTYPGPYTAGAIYSTTGDLLLFHKALQSEILLSNEIKRLAYTEVKNRYGLGWILTDMENDQMVAHSGGAAGYKTDFIRIPEKDICIVLLNNTETGNVNLMAQNILKILYDNPTMFQKPKS
jgi:CubicO group peptidase (beta-lactamase class C family)